MGEGVNGPEEVHGLDLIDPGADFEGSETYRDESECSDISQIDWEEIDRQFEEQRLPGQSYDEFLKTVPKIKAINEQYDQDQDL